uniref:Protoporphyrinogen oxidase n=1 Tax=Neolamprologus brichardi TaxID=32507 RepID=A0A3Q4I6D8_NEOBR
MCPKTARAFTLVTLLDFTCVCSWPMRTVAVLGGGIGGLAASYYLCKSPQVTKVILLEASSRFGGWLWSTRRSDGAVFEHGPRGIRPAGAVGSNTLNMVDDLGLAEEILPVSYSHVASRNRYLYCSCVCVCVCVCVQLADIAVDSLCRGVFAGDCRKLSVRSCFPVLYNAEQHRGSIVLGMLLGSGEAQVISRGPLAKRSKKESWAQWSLKRGMQSFPEAIAENLQQSGRVQLHKEAVVKQIDPSASGCLVPLFTALSSVLPRSCQPLTQQLQDISSVTVAVVNLEYDGAILPVMGFGHLVPSSEDRGLLGVVYDSVPFPQHNRPDGQTTRLTVQTNNTLRHSQCVSEVTPPENCNQLFADCIPQYYEGHFQRVESMRGFIRNNNLALSLTGSCYDGVSVNDVIFSGRTAVEELLGTVV